VFLCVGCAPVKSAATFDVTGCNVDPQGGYQPQQNGVRTRVCPNADTEQALLVLESVPGLLTDWRLTAA
jgi:hypothetical protein